MEIKAPVSGQIKSLKSLQDGVFSTEMMGPGIVIVPDNGAFVAPLTGKLTTAFPTGHAFGITAKDGTNVLLHIGIDTVNLQGKGFTTHVKQGKKIKTGKLLVEVDLNYVQKAAPSANAIVIITPDSTTKIQKMIKTGHVEVGQTIIETN